MLPQRTAHTETKNIQYSMIHRRSKEQKKVVKYDLRD
jgi:hypothetical protein